MISSWVAPRLNWWKLRNGNVMSKKAQKLLEQMRKSKTNWKRHDLETLYRGFGFVIKSGSSHDLVSHPDFPQLIASFPRHTKLAKYIVAQAVALVDKLLELQRQQENSDE